MPRWSPDGKYISFLSSRHEAKDKTQVWLMNRQGGEAYPLTKLKNNISQYLWSPDAKKLLLVVRDQINRPDSMKDKPAKPIVIDRFHFKQDGSGYLEHWEFMREKLTSLPVEEVKPKPLLSGRELIAAGYKPGPRFKEILREIEDAQLEGSISSVDEALRMVREKFGAPGN